MSAHLPFGLSFQNLYFPICTIFLSCATIQHSYSQNWTLYPELFYRGYFWIGLILIEFAFCGLYRIAMSFRLLPEFKCFENIWVHYIKPPIDQSLLHPGNSVSSPLFSDKNPKIILAIPKSISVLLDLTSKKWGTRIFYCSSFVNQELLREWKERPSIKSCLHSQWVDSE